MPIDCCIGPRVGAHASPSAARRRSGAPRAARISASPGERRAHAPITIETTRRCPRAIAEDEPEHEEGARNATALSTPKCTSSGRGGRSGSVHAAGRGCRFRRHGAAQRTAQPSTTSRVSVISCTA